MSGFERRQLEDIRMLILLELSKQNDERLNSSMLGQMLDTWGHRRSHDFVLAQLRWLEEDARAVETVSAGARNLVVAKLRASGRDHIERRRYLPGVARPPVDDD